MISAKNLKIDNRIFGENLLLVEVSEYFNYVNGVRETTPAGYKYTIAMPELAFEKLSVKIPGAKLIEVGSDGFAKVKFHSLDVKPYVHNGNIELTATAAGIEKMKG